MTEKTELKDIKWANKEIKKVRDLLNNKRYEEEVDDLTTGVLSGLKKALNILDQLDEPETLSHEWISKFTSPVDDEGRLYIWKSDLQNVMVPKQELPVIPKFVAEWIESRKNNYPSDVIGAYLRMNETSANEQTREVLSWVHESELNRGSFARAWTDEYEVEEEQKYVVKLPMSKNNDNQYAIVDYLGNIWTDALPSKYKITEEEIRGLTKGDILFEHFAVKVEEFEE